MYLFIYLYYISVTYLQQTQWSQQVDSIWTNLSHKSSILGQMLHACCVTWSYL